MPYSPLRATVQHERSKGYIMRAASIMITAALALIVISASAEEVSDIERFQLWNGCRPIGLVVENLLDGSTARDIGLTKAAVSIAARNRLRAAQLYSESPIEKAWLYVNVHVYRSAFSVKVGYFKTVSDLATKAEGPAITWWRAILGKYLYGSDFILSNVSRYTDKFIDEYLRVNADSC